MLPLTPSTAAVPAVAQVEQPLVQQRRAPPAVMLYCLAVVGVVVTRTDRAAMVVVALLL